MPSVILYYGPYEAYGVIKHRTQRLHGLMQYLNEQKYFVEIVPSEHLNRLAVEMEGSEIFRCDIRFLLFNMNYEEDVVCQRVIAAIQEAALRIYAETNIPKYVSISEGRRYVEKCKNLTTRDCFSPSVELLYEHQEQYKPDKMKADVESLMGPDMHMSLQDTLSDFEEEGDEVVYDEYADWDYASTLIRGILDSLPQDESETLLQAAQTDDKPGFPFSAGNKEEQGPADIENEEQINTEEEEHVGKEEEERLSTDERQDYTDEGQYSTDEGQDDTDERQDETDEVQV